MRSSEVKIQVQKEIKKEGLSIKPEKVENFKAVVNQMRSKYNSMKPLGKVEEMNLAV